MKTTAVWALLILNVALLLLFLVRGSASRPAVAQANGALSARPGDYLMIPGEVINGNDSVVYVLDQTNHLLSAMVYDDTAGALSTMPPVNLDHLFAQPRNQNGGRAAP